MHKEKEKLKLDLNKTEHNFINYCRKKNYCEMKVIVMNGSPVKAYETIKSHRFDLGTITIDNEEM